MRDGAFHGQSWTIFRRVYKMYEGRNGRAEFPVRTKSCERLVMAPC